MDDLMAVIRGLALPLRLLILVGVSLLIHVLVVQVRRLTGLLLGRETGLRYRKLRTIITLTTSITVFMLYFFAVGLILREFGVSLSAYLASASVLGLAIGFGSQGIVQDVVTGLTFIFSDLVDVGDLVEISGQTGIVRGITMRFVELQNALGASVFIPNRSISNVINYPKGYIRCIVDVTLQGDARARDEAERTALSLMDAIHEQFPGILMTAPSREERRQLGSGREILRLKFRIWPNRGQLIETSFVQELTAKLKKRDPDFQSWMIAVGYEVEKRPALPRAALSWPWRS